jgi:site-specific DNA-methyltransferase (adenine-specific)
MANSEIIGAGQDTARPAPKINTITCGECLEVMQTIPDKSVDMILCDLPYGTTSCKWDSIISFSHLWKQYNRLIKNRKAIVLFGSEPFSTALRYSNLDNYKYDWVWNKKKPSNFPLAKKQPMKYHENIMVFNSYVYYPIMVPVAGRKAKKGVNENPECFNGGLNRSDYLEKVYMDKYPSSIIEFSNADQTKRLHPTEKPVALFEYLIRTYTNDGDTVLDNCIGSGTTAIACINTGRNYIGIEKEEKYCRIAEERIHALRSPAQNTMEICHTAPNTAMAKCQQVEIGL